LNHWGEFTQYLEFKMSGAKQADVGKKRFDFSAKAVYFMTVTEATLVEQPKGKELEYSVRPGKN